MRINGSTSVVGIFGYPVTHSFSPQMHNAAFSALRLNYAYIPCSVEPRELPAAVHALRALGIKGVNITVPHKEKVMKLLDLIDPLARDIGSVNTIVNNGGLLTGFNTDASGFLADLKEKKIRPRGKRVLLIGAGGAARAAAFALSRSDIKELSIASRTASHARRLADDIPGARQVSLAGCGMLLDRVDLLINATPLGMNAGDPSPVPGEHLQKHTFVYDMIYHRRTRLLQDAAKAGAKACGGIGMLLNQGAISFELWTGRKAPLAVMLNALKETLQKE